MTNPSYLPHKAEDRLKSVCQWRGERRQVRGEMNDLLRILRNITYYVLSFHQWRYQLDETWHEVLSIRSQGKIIIVPPSLHPRGHSYQLISSTDTILTYDSSDDFLSTFLSTLEPFLRNIEK